MAETYEITSITPRTRAQAGGVFSRVQEVIFTTKPLGVVGQVDVDDAVFTRQHVDAVVAERAALLESVKKL